VVDIQGSGLVFTDPQLHSIDKLYGRADRGTVGFDKFFATHKCNAICKTLGLKEYGVDETSL
jgi:elongation factor 2 kinase